MIEIEPQIIGAAMLMFSSLMFLAISLYKRNIMKKQTDLMNRLFGDLDSELQSQRVNESPNISVSTYQKMLGRKYSARLRDQLSKSGKIGDKFLAEISKRKFLFAAAGLLVGFLYFYSSNNSILKTLLVGLFGFLLPDILLTNTIQKRGEAIEGALPDAVEMLTMCVGAGLTFQQALGKVSENQNSVISTEFARVMSEIQIGEARSSALDGMSDRLNHPDVSKFVSAMHQVDRLGIPVSTVLNEQVKELRGKSKDRAREKAQKVPVKILGPVMVCFLPSVLIIVIGPVILQAISAFQG